MNFIIIGSGPAGIFAAETIRKRGTEHSITIVSQDSRLAHSPVMLTHWMTGKRPQEMLFFRDSSWAAKMRIHVRLGFRASALNVLSRKLILADGEEISYDRLLIATGASPISLPIPGVEAKGVTPLRHLHDAEAILARGSFLREAVVIGGGFIGLKLACHLRERGLGVTVLEIEPRLASRMLDQKGSLLIANKLRKEGIRVESDVEVREILNEKGWVRGVRMRDGRIFPSQSVIQAVGVRPNIQFLAGSGIDLQGGVLVNEFMETNVPGVYAAGDVTMTMDSISSEWLHNATWPAATRQGTVAGSNMAGGTRRHLHNFPLNALTAFDLRIMAAGHPYYEEGPGVDVFVTERKESYRKIVMRAGQVIGFLLVGDISGAGFLSSLMKRKGEIPLDPVDLLSDRVSIQDYLLPNLGYRHGDRFNTPREEYS